MTAPYINGTRQLGDFEYQKFREDSTGKPSIAVVNPDGSSIGSVSGATTYKVKFDTSVTGVVYLGKAAIGSSEADPVWQIKKVDYSDTANGSGLFANGGDFTAIWDDHLTETYA